MHTNSKILTTWTLIFIGCHFAFSTQRIDSCKDYEVEKLIRRVLTWVHSEQFLDAVPGVIQNDSIYIGIDFAQHNKNMIKLEDSRLFAPEFMENHHSWIVMIDKKLRENSFESGSWLVGYYPPFTLSEGGNVWCNCQDVPYESPNPWSQVEIERLDGNSFAWKWGGLQDMSSGWGKFRYRFDVQYLDGECRIARMEGFNLETIR